MRRRFLPTATLQLALEGRYLLSPWHWDRIYRAARNDRTRGGLAARFYARSCRAFDRGFTSADNEAIVTARNGFAAATLLDPGMCDAYLSLLLISAYAEEHSHPQLQGLDMLGLLSAAAVSSARFGEEQRSVGSPIQIVFSPLAFGHVQVESGEDLRLYFAAELYRNGEQRLAKEWLERVSVRNVKRYALQAKFCYFDNQFEEAITLLGPVMESHELRFDALWMIATCLICLNRPHDAIEVLDSALPGLTRHDRAYLFLNYALANAYALLDEGERRRLILEELFELDPHFLDTAQLLGLDLPDGAEVSPQEAAWQEIVAGLRADMTVGDDLLR